MWRHFLNISSHSLLMLVLADFLKEVVQLFMQYECWRMSFVIIYVLITGTLLESQRFILVIAIHVMMWRTFSISDFIGFSRMVCNNFNFSDNFLHKSLKEAQNQFEFCQSLYEKIGSSLVHFIWNSCRLQEESVKSKPEDTLENSLTSFSSSQSKDLHEKINNTLPRNLRCSKNEISIIRHEESARIS